jgi:hypothetical protein
LLSKQFLFGKGGKACLGKRGGFSKVAALFLFPQMPLEATLYAK